MNQGAQKSIQVTEHIVLGSHIVTYPSHILHVTTACRSLVGWLCQTEVPAFQAPSLHLAAACPVLRKMPMMLNETFQIPQGYLSYSVSKS